MPIHQCPPISAPDLHLQHDFVAPNPIDIFHNPHLYTDYGHRMDFDCCNIDHDFGHRNYYYYLHIDYNLDLDCDHHNYCHIDNLGLYFDRRCNMSDDNCRCTDSDYARNHSFRRISDNRCCDARRIDSCHKGYNGCCHTDDHHTFPVEFDMEKIEKS